MLTFSKENIYVPLSKAHHGAKNCNSYPDAIFKSRHGFKTTKKFHKFLIKTKFMKFLSSFKAMS